MSLLAELKRRNVFRVGVAYAVVAWLLIQVIVTVLPQFDAPRWVVQTMIFLLVLGFPVALILAWAFQITPEGIRPDAQARGMERETPVAASRLNPILNTAILGLVVLAVGFLLIDRYRTGMPVAPTVVVPAVTSMTTATQRVSLVLPAAAPLRFGCSPCNALAISPDGTTVAYVTRDDDDEGYGTELVVRQLDSLSFRTLPGTEKAAQPFFSPDGQWIGFFTSDGNLKKVALAGGSAVTLAEDLNGASWGSGTWLDDHSIVFSVDSSGGGLSRVPAEGGAVTELTRPNSSAGEGRHEVPAVIPGTAIVLFTAYFQRENRTIPVLQALDTATGAVQTLLEGVRNGEYIDSGYLLFEKDEVPMLAPFDPALLTFTGPAVPLPEAIRRDASAVDGLRLQLAISRNGTLAYVPPLETERSLYLVSRDGNSEALPLRAGNYREIRVAPDGSLAALVAGTILKPEIRIHDFARGTTSLLSQAEGDNHPLWHPDSRRIVVRTRGQGGRDGLWLKALNGNERLLLEIAPGEPGFRNGSWHPDGELLAITRQQGSEHDIVLLTVGDEVQLEPWLATPATEHSPRFSPDGRTLAYVSDKSGSLQVYLRAFPDGEELRVSTGGGALDPHWSSDGSELFFMQVSGNILRGLNMSVASVDTSSGTPLVSPPQTLFPLSQRNAAGVLESFAFGVNWGTGYDVMPDGRFLMARGVNDAQQHDIILVQNWLTELRTMAPAAN